MCSLCVITPTVGRSTLKRALCSAELGPDDEWIVFGDGPQPEAKNVVRNLKDSMPYLHYIESDRRVGNFGNQLRDAAMSMSNKDYFLFLDDDDIFTPDAIKAVRNRMRDNPVIFQLRHPIDGIVWRDSNLTPGNVGGSMMCLPNDRDKRAQWGRYTGHGSDVEFITNTLPMWNGYDWAGEVIIEVSPI